MSARPGEGAAVLASLSGDRICVLAPYTSADRFAEVTGVEWPRLDDEPTLTSDDGVELVTIIDGGEVVAWTTVERPRGSELLGGTDRCSD